METERKFPSVPGKRRGKCRACMKKQEFGKSKIQFCTSVHIFISARQPPSPPRARVASLRISRRADRSFPRAPPSCIFSCDSRARKGSPSPMSLAVCRPPALPLEQLQRTWGQTVPRRREGFLVACRCLHRDGDGKGSWSCKLLLRWGMRMCRLDGEEAATMGRRDLENFYVWS
jgi:hypothetical protein